jgi:hypothetical protein
MIPSYLYHYTSVEVLLAILRTNTIRFKRLDLMNDPLEGFSEVFSSEKKFVFSSSWSAQSTEALHMWKMYNNFKGVRLRMPVDLFNHGKQMVIEKIGELGNFLIKSTLNKTYYEKFRNPSLLESLDMIKEMEIKCVYGPTMVDYVPNQEALSCDIVEFMENDVQKINLHLIGQKKIDHWCYEKEYRFRLFGNDSIIIFGGPMGVKHEYIMAFPITQYLDIQFREDSLEGVEILLGPWTSPEDKTMIENELSALGIKKSNVSKSKIQVNPDKI